MHRSVILGSWIISRYDDVLAGARDHERFSNDPRCLSETATATVSASAASPVRVSAKASVAPSVAGVLAAAAVETVGSACGSDGVSGRGTVRLSPPWNFRRSASHAACSTVQSVVVCASSV